MGDKKIENSYPGYGKITFCELSASHSFDDLTESNLDGLEVVGIDFGIYEGQFIEGRLHVKKGKDGRKTYKELRDGISLEELFQKFHNIEITIKES